MKQIKRIMAFALALVLALAMSITVFAAETDYTQKAAVATGKASIIVENLSTREQATLYFYKVISLKDNGNGWDIESWAKDYVDSTDYSISDYTALANATLDSETQTRKTADKEANNASNGSYTDKVTVSELETGAYLIVIVGNDVEYSPMFVKTYTYDDNNLISAADATAYAKSANGSITKETAPENDVVYVGEKLTFTITVTVPYPDGKTLKSFSVVDKPTNLSDLTITKLTVGGTQVEESATPSWGDKASDGTYTLDLSSYVQNIGATIEIEYTAVVTSDVVGDTAYSNTAWTNEVNSKNETNKDTIDEGDEPTGKTGTIKITKLSDESTAENQITLAGAQYKVTSNKTGRTANNYIKADETQEGSGVYVFKEWTDADNATRITTNEKGIATIQGVDEGTYTFTEITAPKGYSVGNAVTTTTEISNTNYSEETFQKDTKLASLPSTGGIGTTIFTIAGCLIMIAAAGMYFASRRRNAK